MKSRLTMLCLMALFGIRAQDDKPNLTGTWKYAPTPMARDREIDRIEVTGPEVAMSEKVGMADVIFTLYYRTDGKPPRRRPV